MTVILTSLLLTVFGVFFLYTGVMSFLRPVAFGKSLSLAPVGASGIVEIRAQYGGFFFAAALSQFAPFVGLIASTTAFIVAAIIFGGLILGRIGAAMAKPDKEALSPMIKALYLIDGVGFLASIGALLALSGHGANL